MASDLPRLLTAIVTPFNDDLSIDYESFDNIIDMNFNSYCGVVLFGTTGETSTVSTEEKEYALNRYSTHKYKNRFVVGIGGNNTAECIKLMNFALEKGFINFLATTPYYNKPTQEGLFQHYSAISTELGDRGRIIIYNVPSRTNVNILPETVKRLVDVYFNIYAIKEASGDMNQVIKLRCLCPSFKIYSGDDGLVIPIMAVGGYGLISVISNIYPEKISHLVEECQVLYGFFEESVDTSSCFQIYAKYDKFIRLLFSETNPSPIKYAMEKAGFISTPKVRLPLVEMQDEKNIRLIDKFLSENNPVSVQTLKYIR
uniref:4-hydroxy-tetrahydrodipicolinate synthase n=1 Tax=viral metagenome TaxID=1070528 RepID=A0A6C0EB12_9ZZZZ